MMLEQGVAHHVTTPPEELEFTQRKYLHQYNRNKIK